MSVNNGSALALGRSPHGERGLKYRLHHGQVWIAGGRSPHGERGLKYQRSRVEHRKRWVALLMESVD